MMNSKSRKTSIGNILTIKHVDDSFQYDSHFKRQIVE